MYIPGHITGILGEMGSGKSFVSLLIGFEMAEELQYDVCVNFALDAKALYRYFVSCGYTWLLSRLMHGGIEVKPVSSGQKVDLENWMSRRRCLYILDEAGIFLNARRFQSNSPQFLADLAQIRHDGRKLFWIAQFVDQVDKQLRELTQSYIYCDCITKYSRKLGSTELLFKNYRVFTTPQFKIFSDKVLGKKLGFKSWILSNTLALKSWYGSLTEVDRLLFDIYPSLERIESGPSLVDVLKQPTCKFVTGEIF
ncbi:MAG: ATP-binding protein [Symploca sp. SIO3E6]|nr:ATP-binding protein [Caldora sp. SIO3E6]